MRKRGLFSKILSKLIFKNIILIYIINTMSNNIETLTYPTMNGLKSLYLDELTTDNIISANIDGDYFSINTIEANDVKVDAELELTNTGYIIVGKGTAEESIISDNEIKYLDGLTGNIQEQINTIDVSYNAELDDIKIKTDVITSVNSTTTFQHHQTTYTDLSNNSIGYIGPSVNYDSLYIGVNGTKNLVINPNEGHIQHYCEYTLFGDNHGSGKLQLLGGSDTDKSSILMNGELQYQAFTDEYINKINTNETNIQNISDTHFHNVSDVVTFADGVNTYGKIGQTNPGSNVLVLETDATLNNALYINTHTNLTRIMSPIVQIDGYLIINYENQNYAYTDTDRTNVNKINTIESDLNTVESDLNTVESDLITVESNLNLLEINVGQNITRLDEIEDERANRIYGQASIGWYSVHPSSIGWSYSTSYILGGKNAHSFHNNWPSYFDASGGWIMGTRKMILSFESEYVLEDCQITRLRSKLRVADGLDNLKHSSIYMGRNYKTWVSNEISYMFNGQLVYTIVNGDHIYLDTTYSVQTATSASPPFECHVWLSMNEI